MKRIITQHFTAVVVVFILLSAFASQTNAQILHNIGANGDLNILGTSTDDYIITGTTTTYHVTIQPGYHGTITLRNLTISLSSGIYSPIAVRGQNNVSNLTPVSVVDVILEGNNTLYYSGYSGCAAFQVDQSTHINISAINPFDNTSGILTATQYSSGGGAGIGALEHYANNNEAIATAPLSCGGTGTTAGGNIVISSGKPRIKSNVEALKR
ncbi:MAG: hypothetical protein LBB41_02155 [Prevotellaceae bacterium]|jgi:hypothetical protein|nr:hypothetical protein [Prevotellaceae bacterium]